MLLIKPKCLNLSVCMDFQDVVAFLRNSTKINIMPQMVLIFLSLVEIDSHIEGMETR